MQSEFLATTAAAVAHRSSVLTAMSGLLLGLLLGALDQTIVATALPTIVGEIGGLRDLVLGGGSTSRATGWSPR
jgi:hypothetical protein